MSAVDRTAPIPRLTHEAVTDGMQAAGLHVPLSVSTLVQDAPAPEPVPQASRLAGWERICITIVFVPVTVMALCLAFGVRVIHSHGERIHVLAGRPWMHHLGNLPRAAIFAVWLVPLAELALLVAGQLHYRLAFKRTRRPGT